MLGRMMVEYGAPTLCGMKPGSLFAPHMDETRLRVELRALAPELAARGVRAMPIDAPWGTLMLLVRMDMLREALGDARTARFLSRRGYDPGDAEAALEQLARRVGAGGAFPHEVGVFLGYPLGDVEGFIEHGGRGSAAQGLWKVYDDVDGARRLFDGFLRCTAACRRLFDGGVPLYDLAANSLSKTAAPVV